jgi:hypothetical protein
MYGLTGYIDIGDIILIRGNAKHSKAISVFTKGHFSHACLVVGKSIVVEALGGSGVQITSMVKFIIKDKENIAVLRPKFKDDAQANIVKGYIEEIAKRHQSREYNLIDAIKSVLNRENPTHQDKFFCSHLVASICSEAGFPLTTKKDHNVTPNDFIRSGFLTNITEKAVELVPKHIQEGIIKSGKNVLIDYGCETTSSTALAFRDLIDKTKPIFLEYGLTPPSKFDDIILALTDQANACISLEMDDKITAVYDSIEVINQILKDNSTEPIDINEYEKLAKLNEDYFVEKEFCFLIYTHNKILSRLETYSSNAEVFNTIYLEYSLCYADRICKYYLTMLELGTSLLNSVVERIQVLNKYRQLPLETPIINAQEKEEIT